MVIIEDITEAEAAREAAEKAAAEAQAAAAAAAAAAAEAARQAAAAQQAAAEQQAAAAAAHPSSQETHQGPGGDAGTSQGQTGTTGPAGDGTAVQNSPPAELSEADKEQLAAAEALKKEGNELYARDECEQALERYAAALEAAPEAAAAQRAVYHGNRAAAHLKLEQWTEAAQECSAALELDAGYTKVLLRRCTAYEKLDDLERALMDAQKVLELDPGNVVAQRAATRLTPVVEERREKLKDEMMGKLKELGNMVLGKFGLSVDNFKAEQDPSSGSYSIKFQQ